MSDSVRPHRRQPTRLCYPWDSPGKNTGVGCHFLLQCIKVKREREVTQSCPTLRDPMDCSLPSSSVCGIFQARVLEWVAIAFSEAFSSCINCGRGEWWERWGGGCSLLWCSSFSLRWFLSLWSTGSRREDSVVCHTALVALQHVGSSWTRDQISVSCIGRWILNNWITREGPGQLNLTEVTLCDFWSRVLEVMHLLPCSLEPTLLRAQSCHVTGSNSPRLPCCEEAQAPWWCF